MIKYTETRALAASCLTLLCILSAAPASASLAVTGHMDAASAAETQGKAQFQAGNYAQAVDSFTLEINEYTIVKSTACQEVGVAGSECNDTMEVVTHKIYTCLINRAQANAKLGSVQQALADHRAALETAQGLCSGALYPDIGTLNPKIQTLACQNAATEKTAIQGLTPAQSKSKKPQTKTQ